MLINLVVYESVVGDEKAAAMFSNAGACMTYNWSKVIFKVDFFWLTRVKNDERDQKWILVVWGGR